MIRTNEKQHHQDHNLKAAYLHLRANALTSVLAIVALTTGKYFGWVWLDPVIGIVGAGVVLNGRRDFCPAAFFSIATSTSNRLRRSSNP